MKNIRLASFLAIIIFTGLLIASCGSTEEKLIGTWTTESVSVSIDSTKASPSQLASIEKAIASAKTTTFILNEDHTMSLKIDGFNSDAYWSFNKENNMVSLRFEEEYQGAAIELGKYVSGDIVYTSDVIHGTLTSVYVKE